MARADTVSSSAGLVVVCVLLHTPDVSYRDGTTFAKLTHVEIAFYRYIDDVIVMLLLLSLVFAG